ncbi:MAG: hypothetical protein Ta2A_14560 [Treponemataceae bacterium]|nr:MAG: hypothetical protein Ta2A_14560 [Treponemataceae bacterium]
MIYVLDACALIALLNGEAGNEKIDELFVKAQAGKITLVMSIINLLEVYYGYVRDESRQKAIDILAPLYETRLKIVDRISPFVYDEAARLKAVYRCSLADAIGIATAAEISGQFVTSDHHELETIAEQEAARFFWFRCKHNQHAE